MTEWIRLTTSGTGRPISVRASAIKAFEPYKDGSRICFADQVLDVRETYDEVHSLLEITSL